MNLDALILTIKSNAGIDSTDTQYDTRLTSAINQEEDQLSQSTYRFIKVATTAANNNEIEIVAGRQ